MARLNAASGLQQLQQLQQLQLYIISVPETSPKEGVATALVSAQLPTYAVRGYSPCLRRKHAIANTHKLSKYQFD